MAKAEKKYKLDLSRVLNALDTGEKNFYSKLAADEKKAYAPVVLMRYMSVLGDQNRNKEYAIIAVNDLVNIGFWQLSKYPELQHMLLCVSGIGTKQYHQWIPAKNKRAIELELNRFFLELYPDANSFELDLHKSQYDKASFNQLLIDAGKSEKEIKELMEEWKKHSKNG